jgi:hypothetical protein
MPGDPKECPMPVWESSRETGGYHAIFVGISCRSRRSGRCGRFVRRPRRWRHQAFPPFPRLRPTPHGAALMAPQAVIGAAPLSDNHAFEPSGRDDRESSKDRQRSVVPSGNGHNQETTNSEQLHRRCHVAFNIDAEGRLFQSFKIGETEHQSRGNERGNHRDSDGERKIAPPKEIKAKRCRAGVSHQFGRMNLVEEYPVIQGHQLSWNAHAPTASASISDQRFATNFAAASLTRAKSGPTSSLASLASGSGDQVSRCARHSEMLPAKMIKAQSVLAVFDALVENSLTIRSGPNRSSIIVSEMWTYFSFRAASAAPATANRLDDIRSALVRPGVASKAPETLMAADQLHLRPHRPRRLSGRQQERPSVRR